MQNIKNEVAYNSFTKGIITEAGPLTYPENASLDEQNFILNRDGSRQKRLGMDYEDNYVLKSTDFGTSQVEKSLVSFHRWDYPKGNLQVSLGIVRIYNSLWFINLLNTSPSTEFKNSGNPLVLSSLINGRIDTAYINNDLVIVGEDLPYPIKLIYNETTDTVTTETLYLKIRDFFGIDDGLDISTRPTTLSNEHHYNLKNQGWSNNIQVKNYSSGDGAGAGAAIQYTREEEGFYPSNADIWYYGRHENPNKNTFGYYVPNELKKESLNNSQAPKGSFIIDFKNRGASRATASGVSITLADTELGNLTCVCAFAGRLFYSGISSSIVSGDKNSPNYSGYVFFTPTLFNNKKLDQCYQEADPSGEKVSDLIATDGGAIVIPEMIKVVKMVALNDAIIIFAENGVWGIFGGESGFKASEYQIKKLSDSGTSFATSIILAEGSIYYWNNNGIFVLGIDPASGALSTSNLSLMAIQSLYNEYSQPAKENTIGIYEERNSRIRWLLNTSAGYDGISYRNKYDTELIYDIALNAFYPFKVNINSSTFPYLAAHMNKPSYSLANATETVVVNGVSVEVNAVSVEQTVLVASPETFNPSYIVLKNNSGTFYFTIGKYKNTTFKDWVTHNTVGQDYDCYLVTGYEIFKDAMRKKQVPYLYVYCYQTEDGYTTSGTDLILKNQSSCLVQAQWNWTNSSASNRWGTQFQAYRHLRNWTPVDVNDQFLNGEEVIVTRNKLRGVGKSLSLYISAEAGKNLHLIGWALNMTATQMPV